MKILSGLLCVALLAACGPKTPEGSFVQNETGVDRHSGRGQRAARAARSALRSHRARHARWPMKTSSCPRASWSSRRPRRRPAVQGGSARAMTSCSRPSQLVAHVSLANGAVTIHRSGRQGAARGDAGARARQGRVAALQPGQPTKPSSACGQHQNAQMNLNGEDVELAQHNMDIAVPFVVSSRNYGVLWDNNCDHAHRQSEAVRLRVARSQDPRRGGQGRRLHRALLHRRPAQARARREGHQLPVHPRPLQLAEGTAGAEGAAHRLAAQHPAEPDRDLGRHARVAECRPAQVPALRQQLFQGVRRRQAGARSLAPELGRLVSQLRRDRWKPASRSKSASNGFRRTATSRCCTTIRCRMRSATRSRSLRSRAAPSTTTSSRAPRRTRSSPAIAQLTGKAVMLPRWAYGFWQSRQRYTTQAELFDVVAEYRKRKIPLDNIVLDWFYWNEDAWGSHEFDTRRASRIRRRMIDKVHAQNARLMISVWPKFYPTTANYKELDAAGFMYRKQRRGRRDDWVGPGYTVLVLRSVFEAGARHVLAPGQREARRARRRCLVDGRHRAGSALEPRHRFASRRASGPTAMGPADASTSTPTRWCTAAACTKARAPRGRTSACSSSRARASRASSAMPPAVWSGDIVSRWDDLYNQISAGVSIGYSGLPNWTFDIGGFANEARYSTQKPAACRSSRSGASSTCAGSSSAPSRRCSARMASSRCARSTTSRRKDPRSTNSLVWHDKLRYRLLPYIYTVAADTYHRDGTIMRGLAMDFTDDAAGARRARRVPVRQGLPGRAGVPVQGARAPGLSTGRRRLVRLPHRRDARGRPDASKAAAPLSRMPLYVRAGSIVPVGPDDPVHGREAGCADHAVRVHRQRRLVRSLRGRWRELRLREAASSRAFRCVTTRPRAR